ncbi:hypothetical protein PROFUN_00790 [Planoprotostelium fungivorum]|uniref:Uncharacterized protein n=1 Tax=Planoprotostelium fungivorum TaxID=1890364 RepID=A0A2P6NZZ1_9EUKA|nr:hypothetical protein PROFUN_00790 [Planoprotostelium fungivorum]
MADRPVCSECGKSYVNKGGLKSHIKRMHPGFENEVVDLTDDTISNSTTTKTEEAPSQPSRPKADPTEKRRGRTRNFTNAISDRLHRAKSQRMYLISRSTIGPRESSFSILGSVGNIYIVTINKTPNCTCPDFAKGNLCKHIIFVYLRVLRVSENDRVICQSHLLDAELDHIFDHAPKDPSATFVASSAVRKKYKQIQGGEHQEEEEEEETGVKRQPINRDDCPICYELMKEGKEEIVWCSVSCGNNIHKTCFDTWQKSKQGKADCVWCRAQWPKERKRKKSGEDRMNLESSGDSYVNLAELQPGMSTERDTSTYNQYGWNRYKHYDDDDDDDDGHHSVIDEIAEIRNPDFGIDPTVSKLPCDTLPLLPTNWRCIHAPVKGWTPK